MAAWAAALTESGTSKCGWPMLRLTGSLRLRASSKTLRMPDDSMWLIRSAIQRSAGDGIGGTSGRGKNSIVADTLRGVPVQLPDGLPGILLAVCLPNHY